MQGRVGDAEALAAPRRHVEVPDRRDVRLDQRDVVDHADEGPCTGRGARRESRADERRRLDRLVGGRDDLGAVVVVDLVAVVPGGVVAGGHDDAGCRAEVPDRERGERRRQRPVEDVGGDAARREHVDGVAGELGRAVARVAPDDDARERRPGSLAP